MLHAFFSPGSFFPLHHIWGETDRDVNPQRSTGVNCHPTKGQWCMWRQTRCTHLERGEVEKVHSLSCIWRWQSTAAEPGTTLCVSDFPLTRMKDNKGKSWDCCDYTMISPNVQQKHMRLFRRCWLEMQMALGSGISVSTGEGGERGTVHVNIQPMIVFCWYHLEKGAGGIY